MQSRHSHAHVTRDTRVTHAHVTRESRECHRVPSRPVPSRPVAVVTTVVECLGFAIITSSIAAAKKLTLGRVRCIQQQRFFRRELQNDA